MEDRASTHSNTNGEGIGLREHDNFKTWDAVPRDGPAVFVVDIEVLDRDGRIEGRWISLAADEHQSRSSSKR